MRQTPEREEFARRFLAGESYAVMSQALGVSVGTLEWWRHDMGLPPRNGHRTTANLYGRPMRPVEFTTTPIVKMRGRDFRDRDELVGENGPPCSRCGRTRWVSGKCRRCGGER